MKRCEKCGYELRESITRGTYCPNLSCTPILKKCSCCTLELEVIDGSPFCHYCYLRECVVNPGKCENAQLREGASK